jgi:DNA polymerase I
LKTLTIIDTFGFLFRSYYALPPLKSKSGFPTGMITGFMNFIASIGRDFQTDYIIFALDAKGDSFRNEIYNEYKAHRPEAPEDLKAQLPVVIELIEKMGFTTAMKSGYEADDIIASLCEDAKTRDIEVRIVSHDKDLYQLIDDNIYMFDPIKKKVVSKDECKTKYGVEASQFIDYQALVGDSADNVPGVKGVGAKTATALINQFNDIENLYENLEKVEKPRWKTLLEDSKELAFISKQLVTLHRECISFDEFECLLEEMGLPEENPILKVADDLRGYDMHNVINRVFKEGTGYKTVIPEGYKEEEKQETTIEHQFILINDSNELIKTINEIPKGSILAFDTETTGLDTANDVIVGFSFCWDGVKAYYVPLAHFYLGSPDQISNGVAKQVITLLNNRHKLVVHNFKYDYEIVKNNLGIELNIYFDTMIGAWLYESDKAVGLDKLASNYFNHTMIAFKDVVKKGEDFSSVEIEKACDYAAEDAWITKRLYDVLIEKVKEENLLEIANELEFPFIKVLSSMQTLGVKVDTSVLETLKIQNKEFLENLTNDIYDMAGTQFNLNSPKQMGEVLFEHMGLPHGKKTKTGYSTNEQVLQKLKDEHKIVAKILEYREAFKLQSTYIEPLLEIANKEEDKRIHTSFIQTGTATGRLSSKNPNLQNIPVKNESGRKIREAFIARDGYKLLSIDYSQIELRLLAHFSKDDALVTAFNNDEDIHLRTSIGIFGEEDALENRHIAKSINFGLLYGMGSKKLGETIGISTKEAKGYIEKYFASFTNIKGFIESSQNDVEQKGYIKTLLGRKRKFDFASATPMLKAAYLREGVNAIFQGSAADLIKMSMVKLHDMYINNDEVNMLLQIHDELIFEIKEDKIQEYEKEILEVMEGIYTLEVPLKAGITIGNNWGELK